MKVKITVHVRAEIDDVAHEETKTAEVDHIEPDTTPEQVVKWFMYVAREGWLSYFNIIGMAMRFKRSPPGTPIMLRALPETPVDE